MELSWRSVGEQLEISWRSVGEQLESSCRAVAEQLKQQNLEVLESELGSSWTIPKVLLLILDFGFGILEINSQHGNE